VKQRLADLGRAQPPFDELVRVGRVVRDYLVEHEHV
jgi:hypothetical protein